MEQKSKRIRGNIQKERVIIQYLSLLLILFKLLGVTLKWASYFKSGPPEKFELTKIAIQKCIRDVLCWMDSNKLMLNTDKTEVMIVDTASCVKQVASNSITILNSDIKIQESVKYLGVRLVQTLSMSSHISDVCRSSFLSLRRIGCIRPYLSDRATSCLVNSVVKSRLDFCNSSLTGITTDQLNILQRIQNCAARLIMKKRKYDHITPSYMSFTGYL